MAGIYIHIPFCRQKCYYCDFYKTVNISQKQQFIAALLNEAKLRKNYLRSENIETIYFGGGTPSVLQLSELEAILQMLSENYSIHKNAEITFEANPDDLTNDYLLNLKTLGINRLSLGIQAFQDRHLKKMNRRHNIAQAVEVVKNAAQTGFDNISVDLIYGIPDLTQAEWKDSLKQVFQLPVQHLSAYHLTYHEGTPFYTWLKKGTLKELSEEESVQQFNTLIEMAEKAGFEQYEISNFARDEMYSKHNSAYWFGKKYLGLGPSAHSYDLHKRRWNIARVESYVHRLENGEAYFEEEQLGKKEHYNEFILTRIRTKWGVDTSLLNERYGTEYFEYFLARIDKYKENGTIIHNNNKVTLARHGLLVSDEIMSELMII